MEKITNIVELAEKIQSGEISMEDANLKKAQGILAKLASTEEGRMEIAQLIVQNIEDDFNKFDIAPYIFETKKFALGDEALFKTHKKGIVAYTTAPNAYVPKSQNYETEFSMDFENLGVRPTCLLQDLKTGRVDSLASLISGGKEAVELERMKAVYTLLAQTYNATQNEDNYFVSNTVNKATLDAAINRVRKKVGGRPVIIGDYDLMTQIENFDGFKGIEDFYKEIKAHGVLGTYRGCKLIYLPEILNPVTGESIVPTDKIMVVGQKIGYAASKGEPVAEQEKNIDDMTWSARYDKRVGYVVTKPAGMCVISISADSE